MPRFLRQGRAQHWAAFMAAMATRHAANVACEVISSPSHHVAAASAPLSMRQPDNHRVPPPPQMAIDAFGAHLLQATRLRQHVPAWWRDRTYRRFAGQCAYCDRPVTRGPSCCFDHVIPPAIGGPNHVDAIVLCCRGCKRAKAGRDLLLWRRQLSPCLQAMRHQLAQESWNHSALPSHGRTEEQADVLNQRWCLPRFACHFMQVDGATLLGWARPRDAPVAAYMSLLYEHYARPCRTADQLSASPVIFWMPTIDDGQGAAADLIERNAWIRPTWPFGRVPGNHSRPTWLESSPGARRPQHPGAYKVFKEAVPSCRRSTKSRGITQKIA